MFYIVGNDTINHVERTVHFQNYKMYFLLIWHADLNTFSIQMHLYSCAFQSLSFTIRCFYSTSSSSLGSMPLSILFLCFFFSFFLKSQTESIVELRFQNVNEKSIKWILNLLTLLALTKQALLHISNNARVNNFQSLSENKNKYLRFIKAEKNRSRTTIIINIQYST